MKRDEFLAQLGERPFLLDGSMGALIHAKGVPADISLDIINLQNPSIVAEIHREYIEAGADIIETNSFAANRFKLAEHGLQGDVVAINTFKNKYTATKYWIDYLHTPTAKSKLLRHIKHEEKEVYVNKGI